MKNTGSLPGAVPVQVYVKAERPGTPNAQLKGLKKVTLAPGEDGHVTVMLPAAAFSLCDEAGNRVVEQGTYSVYVGQSQPDERSRELLSFTPARIDVTCERTFAI